MTDDSSSQLSNILIYQDIFAHWNSKATSGYLGATTIPSA